MVLERVTSYKRGADNMYVHQLDGDTRTAVEASLIIILSRMGYSGEELAIELDNAMNSRVRDLRDLIDIDDYTA
ncbi:hypothetical protein [Phage f2b1]|nr:hypothetical protein [Phage f2b1]